MLRATTLMLFMIAAANSALGADLAPYPGRAARVAPPPAQVETEPLISSFVWTTPLLPGSYTLPGYYGRPFDYYYQGAYYGGEYGNGYEPYFIREPYACGVTGYC